MTDSIKATVTASQGDNYVFPEQAPGFDPANSSGICFSGGGTRALSAAMGQMRALNEMGVLKNADYISCVSGGSWASSIYTYYKSGPKDDKELLGSSPDAQERKSWELVNWQNNLCPTNLAYPATENFVEVLLKHMEDSPDDLAWIYAVRDVFFKPFGLDKTNNFSLDSASVSTILAENRTLQPDWNSDSFDITQPDRPYLIVNATFMWPIQALHNIHRVLIQFTPLYVGNPCALQLKESSVFEKTKYQNTGGGMLGSYAFGSSGPNANAAPYLDMPMPNTAFPIWHASGISSAAYGYKDAESKLKYTEQYIPRMPYWAVTDSADSQEKTQSHYFTDGGNLENFGLIALLQRKVQKIIIFLNSETPIAKDSEGNIVVDSDLAPLFGHNMTDFPNNCVFEPGLYENLLEQLWHARSNGDLCMYQDTFKTLHNPYFGTPAYSPEVLWVYNAPVDNWIGELSTDMQAMINEGIQGEGTFKDFPNFKTIGERWFHLIDLSHEQVACIADMYNWSMQQHKEAFTGMLPPRSRGQRPW